MAERLLPKQRVEGSNPFSRSTTNTPMPKLRLSREHNSTKENALDVLDRQIPDLLESLGGNVSDPRWQRIEDTFRFSGKTPLGRVKGTLKVGRTLIELEADIPWAALPLKGQAERALDRWVDEVFGPQ